MNGEDIDQAEVDRRFVLVRERYGQSIDPTAFGDVRQRIEGIVDSGKDLRAVKLDDSVEPFSVFAPYRNECSDD